TTFHQTVAGLAIARRLKAWDDPPVVVFGGANCEGEMGSQLARSFPWIDYVCTGEGDLVVPDFIEALLGGGDPPPADGIVSGSSSGMTLPALVEDMDGLPYPDFDDYFAQAAELPLAPPVRASIETARGCWWGAKHHCTFCGLNGLTMPFRSKSPDRVFDEVMRIGRRYDTARVDAVDNILDLRYVETLFPRLAEADYRPALFFETKANLTHRQLRLLRAGGVESLQPGIESLSDQVLTLMRKGCTAQQNVRLLRWCAELDVEAWWNVIYGFPGEDPDEYARMADLIPLIAHLQPPRFVGPIRLDRFSPYHSEPGAFGIDAVRPAPAYREVFPVGDAELERLAYYFDFDANGAGSACDPGSYVEPTRDAIREWLRAAPTARLDAVSLGDAVLVLDDRPCARQPSHVLTGAAAAVHELADSPRTTESLVRELRDGYAEPEVEDALAALVNARLVWPSGDRNLTLAVFRNRDPDGGA
ncbi:MAG: RiPP maturation radical SAM C-methyltransferase, partial [Actinomycetota bacterium]|nr:RiPP maturation radical SAM C-methyltransferase [Actinomycetota bacterium]